MSSRSKNFIWILVVLVAFTGITLVRGGFENNINFGEDSLTLFGPEKYSYTVVYDDITAITLVDLTDLGTGTSVSGDENRNCKWGVYKNDLWNEYTLCISKKIENAIQLTLHNGDVVVFNLESAETTAAILDMFEELLSARMVNTSN